MQRTIAQWKKDGEVQSLRGDGDRAKILNTRDRRSLKRLVKANRRKNVQQLISMFNEGTKKIYASTIRRELKKWVYGVASPPASHLSVKLIE